MKDTILRLVRCSGIRPDTLGDYLAGLGLLSALARLGPGIRGCWRENAFVVAGEELDASRLEAALVEWRPSPYTRWWAPHQKADTKAKSDANTWMARNRAPDQDAVLLDAHIVGSNGRNRFNPLLGTGGNIGKRDLESVNSESLRLIGEASVRQRTAWLHHTLFGNTEVGLPELRGAGTWFVFANKTFNSGSDWYREGQLSPWSFVLALEGARLMAGSSSKRLGALRQYAAFPFISTSAAAESSGDASSGRAEFWAPLWEPPATLPAIRALLGRGQARIGNRAATTAFEFALAARTAGLDAGVKQFARFALRQTTSRQTFEAVPQERIASSDDKDDKHVEALAGLVNWVNRNWVNRLPRDGPNDDRFYGIRGRVEKALIRVAEEPDQPERWRDLLLLLARSQAEIDRNSYLRESCIPVPPLDPTVFEAAWPHTNALPKEIEIARAIAAINLGLPSGGRLPLRENIFGVQGSVFPKTRPATAVWSDMNVVASMANVLERRLVDAERHDSPADSSTRFCHLETVYDFIEGVLDDDNLGSWIPTLSLIDWKHQDAVPPARIAATGGTASLHDLFRPLFNPLPGVTPKAATRNRVCRHILKLIRQNLWSEAIDVARARYLSEMSAQVIEPPPGIQADGERIAAALLIPVPYQDALKSFEKKWKVPERNEEKE